MVSCQLLLCVLVLCNVHCIFSMNAVRQWNQVGSNVTIKYVSPDAASRAMAMLHVATLDALYNLNCHKSSSSCTRAASTVAVSTAAHRVLSALFTTEGSALDATLFDAVNSVGSNQQDAIRIGTDAGHRAGVNVIISRTNDGSMSSEPYHYHNITGSWVPTPPDYVQTPKLTHYGNVRPFMTKDIWSLLPTGVPAFNSAAYKNAWDEVFWYGSVQSRNRSADQTAQAIFWNDEMGTVFHDVAAELLHGMKRSDDILYCAEVFMLLSVARANAAIASRAVKFRDNTWRPVTAIRQGVPSVSSLVTDPTWTPFLVTPVHPDYVSGHSVFAAASARILALIFGKDAFTFTGIDIVDRTRDRQFNSLWAAAEESGQSRIYGGIHFQFANRDGLQLGKRVSDAVYDEWLLHSFPVSASASVKMNVALLAASIVFWMFTRLASVHL